MTLRGFIVSHVGCPLIFWLSFLRRQESSVCLTLESLDSFYCRIKD
ncbi:MAG: hypothetical protein ACYCSW_05725 [bacterium]